MEGMVREFNRQHKSRRHWRRFWSMMAAFAAFCTTYVLILPAITMSRQLVCGMEEHTHAEECYEQQPVLTCGLETGHSHTEDCYTQETVWICGLEETEGHSHTESCFEKQAVMVCGQEESESHAHTDSCLEEQSVIICGQEEKAPHTHSEACSGTEEILTCGLPEAEAHVHGDGCYELQNVFICTLEEHTHSEFCYDVGPADANADVETRENWEKAFSKLEFTEHRDENVVAVAMTQLGYRESKRNYVAVDELTLNGYTRYGAWYGDPYGDWDAMFASFVLHYAEVDDFGKEQDPAQWAKKIAEKTPDRFQAAGSYQPGIGDLVFFDRDLDDEIDGVGILMEATEDTWRVIEGNQEDAVSLESYALGDNRIVAFGVLGTSETAEPGEENVQPSEGAEAGGTGDGETEPTGETTGEETEYTVTYLANNGTEEMGQQKGSGEVTLTWQGFTVPEGKLFSSWNTAPDGTGTDYDDGETLTLTENVTLYAQWIEEDIVSLLSTPLNSTRAAGSITLKKQIEYTGKNADDYSYRLHLTLDGSTLSAGSTTTIPSAEKRRIGILLDVTETMTSRGESWDGSGNKFDVVWSILREQNGLLDTILDGNTEVFVIKVGSASTGSDRMGVINSGTILNDFTFSGSGNSLHQSQPISYVTGLNAAEKYLGDSLDSLVFIVGNETTHYESYKSGVYDRTISGSGAAKKNFEDYQTFMTNHPKLSMYMLGVASQSGSLEHHNDCGEYTAEKWGQYSKAQHGGGGYFKASNKTELQQQLTQIAQQIVVPADKVSGITVTDQLSAYVTLAGTPNYSAVLTMLNSDGSVKSTTDITGRVSMGEDGVLTCAYPDEIKGPFKLEIGFNIQTKDGVYRPNPETGYPDTGGAGTDWGTSTTSSGQKGYYSNGNANAVYTLNDTGKNDSFPQPVVQAPEKATIQLTKVWEKAEEADKQPVTVELHRGSAAGELVGTVELNADNSWTATGDVKILTMDGASNKIFVVEQAVEGFDASYSVQSVEMAANGNYSITVTNTKTVVKKTAKLTVTKGWKNVPGTQSAVIHVCVKNGTNYTDIEGSPITVNNGGDSSNTFNITWTEETPLEIYVYEESSKDFYPVFSGDGTAQVVAIGDKQYSAMELTPEADKNYTVTLTNMASVQMPETGGTGTDRYVFGGLALMLGAVLLMQIPKIKPKGGQEAPPSGEK